MPLFLTTALNLAENEAQAARLVFGGMAAHFFPSFALRASTVGRGEEHAFLSRIDQMEKSKGLGSGFVASQTS